MPGDIARQWFIPGDGIDRHVISADIQRYLGNDATVRPGQGTGSDKGIQGYWIKAYRNLTSAMIADLRADSARWRQEQRSTGTRGPYEASSTYNQSSAGRVQRRDADSPSMEYSGMSGGRMPTDRRQAPPDAMQIDPPAPQADRRGGYSHGQPAQRGYQQESRGFAPPQDSRNYPQDTMMQDTYGRPPVTSSYQQDSRFAPSYPPQSNEPAMSAFGRQPQPAGNYYSAPVSSSYDPMPAMSGRPQDPAPYGSGPFGGQPQQAGRQDHYRDQREPRFTGRGGFDPSDAYPSPAATVSSMREPMTTSPNPSMYSQSSSYQADPYGRTMPSQSSLPSGFAQPSSRDNYQRERPPPSTGDSRDARRRRH